MWPDLKVVSVGRTGLPIQCCATAWWEDRVGDMTMTQIKTPASRKRFAEPEFIPPISDPAAPLALWGTMLDARRPRRAHDVRIEGFVVALLAPAVVVAAGVIVVALLGYFVAWLCFVGVLLAGMVIADQVIE
jgi:hypothetical protein